MTKEEALKWLDTIMTQGEQVDALEMAIEALKNQKTGHWIELGCVGNDNYDFECSECHHTDTQSKTVKVNYCWYCGAKMKGENNPDCRNCDKWKTCENGEKGHTNGTSIGYSIGECKDYGELKGEGR